MVKVNLTQEEMLHVRKEPHWQQCEHPLTLAQQEVLTAKSEGY